MFLSSLHPLQDSQPTCASMMRHSLANSSSHEVLLMFHGENVDCHLDLLEGNFLMHPLEG